MGAERGRAALAALAPTVTSALASILLLAACAPLLEPGRGAEYRHYALSSPRELHVHVVEIDLEAAGARLAVRSGPDPDGEGPAEASLANPLALASRSGSLALVNANAFAVLPGDGDAARPLWFDGRPVQSLGWVVEEGVEGSAFDPAYAAVWALEDGRVGIGTSPPAGAVRAAAAGFLPVLDDGVALAGDEVLHPRSGIGVDPSGRRIWLAVVDGRRPGYSMGMSTTEWGLFFRDRLGAWDALNLDGGGSSALIIACADGSRRVVNLPSDAPPATGYLRPVPVMLSVEED